MTEIEIQKRWEDSIQSLKDKLKPIDPFDSDALYPDFPPPNEIALCNAILGMYLLQLTLPSYPPDCIMPEPGSGLIVESHFSKNDKNYIWELTLYNNGKIDQTLYENGKIIHANY